MLEILSHQYLKKFVKSQNIEWDHIYSFGRIVSNCIQNNATYLVNSEIFSTRDWIPAILIPLFLSKEDSTFVLSHEKIQFLKSKLIEDLKSIGFKYILKNDQIIFPTHRVQLLTLKKLLKNKKLLNSKKHRIVFTGIENIKQDLKNYFRISLFKKDWINLLNPGDPLHSDIIKIYIYLNKQFFSRKVLGNSYLFLNQKELSFLANFFEKYSYFSDKFFRASKALSQGWACWVKLDNTNLEWDFHLEPIDELSQIREFLTDNHFVFLSSLRRDNFFKKYIKKQNVNLDLVINFKSNFSEKKILLYVPPKQMLPNNPLFTKVIVEKCKKLLVFRKGFTLVLCDDIDLKTNLATELASNHGKKVLLEAQPFYSNQILCASYDWWIKNSSLIQIPEQIILPLLPIPNMSEPINMITVSTAKKLSKDWFREFLFTEAILKLERAVSPLRKNSGKLIIFDGRANKRKWGRLLLQSIQPSKQINYMLPCD